MKKTIVLAMFLAFAVPMVGMAQDRDAAATVLFTNVHVFDGVSEERIENASVLVEGNMITQVSTDEINASGATVIDGGGRVLMPGLSDTHTHVMFASLPQATFLLGDPSFNYIYATKDAREMLMRGITSIRDMAGNSFGLKAAIDQGLVPGPRIYPSGGMLSQTGGHGDFRLPNQTNPLFGGYIEQLYLQGHGYMVDGVPAVLAAAREVLRKGASQVKIAAGGGYSSPADPLTGAQFTYDEIKAAVDAASNWGSYVTIHAYHPEAINVALDAGVKGRRTRTAAGQGDIAAHGG